jgi:hypothetical protein
MTARTVAALRRLSVAVVVPIAVGVVFSFVASARGDEKKPADPREMFRFLGAGDAYFEQLTSGVPVDADELDPLLRILYKLRQFPPVDLERWAQSQDKLGELIAQAGRPRGSIFRLRGRVIAVEPRRPSAEQATRYEMQRYFRCRLQLDSSPCIAEVFTENVPVAWQKGGKLDVAGGAFGVFLKLAGKKAGRETLVFVAPRLAWYPDDLLGELGMDYGLLDDLRHPKSFSVQERKALDHEAFYQMLAAVGRAKPGQLFRQAEAELPKSPETSRWTDAEGRQHYSVIPLYKEPATQIGRLVWLSGTARLIEEVRVENADTAARFGFDHYYQVSMFTDDSGGYPLTFCVRELPEGMPYGNIPRYGEAVHIAGFFFKMWSYPVQKMADPSLMSDPKTHQQPSPLLIGRSLVWYPAPKPIASKVSGAVIIGLLVVVMLAIWAVAWRTRRSEKRWAEREAAPPQLDSGIKLDQVEAKPEKSPDAEPNFGQIAEMDHGAEKQDTE